MSRTLLLVRISSESEISNLGCTAYDTSADAHRPKSTSSEFWAPAAVKPKTAIAAAIKNLQEHFISKAVIRFFCFYSPSRGNLRIMFTVLGAEEVGR